MSGEALEWHRAAVLPTLPADLLTIGVNRRPSYLVTALVAYRLADAHRTDRGHANESIDQLCDVLHISPAQARRALDALHDLGRWVRVGKGNQHEATKRVPAFTSEHGAVSRAMRSGEHGAVHRAVQRSEHRAVAGEHGAVEREHRAVRPRDTPTTPTSPRIAVVHSACDCAGTGWTANDEGERVPCPLCREAVSA